MRLEYVTHASLFLKAEKATLLTDPFFFFDRVLKAFLCHYPPRKLSPAHFGRIDYVYCSHIHDDHCHRHTLKRLKKQIGTLLLPAGKRELILRMQSLGFKKIVLLENEKPVKLKEGFEVTSYHDRNGVDTALVVKNNGVTVLHQNDCALDLPTFRRMAGAHRIDYAFFPFTLHQDLYPLLLSRPKEELLRLAVAKEEAFLEYPFECLKILKPRWVIPYAYTATYTNEDQGDLNGMGKTLPTVFRDKLKTRLPDQPCRVLQPGDMIDTDADTVTPYREENLWGKNLEEHLVLSGRYAAECRKKGPPLDFGGIQKMEKRLIAFMKKRLSEPLPKEFAGQVIALHVHDNKGQKTFYVDSGRKTFGTESDAFPFMEITIPALYLDELIKGDYDRFMILYTYRVRFKLNIYLGLDPAQECHFYIRAFLALFDYENRIV